MLLWGSLLASPVLAQPHPTNDYHQHLLSPAVAQLIGAANPFTASDLIPLLDAAGIRRAVILSMAYQFGNPNRPAVADEYSKVRAENDWTAAQVAQYPDRLVAFCGVDPLRDYAVEEVERCAGNPYLKTGLKLHFGNSDVDLEQPEQIAKLRAVFNAADRHGMAIVVHLHANVNHNRPYGARQAQIFLDEVLPAAPHVAVQIAHLAGAGGFDDPATDQALGVFLEAIARRDPRVKHLYFDISGVAGLGEWQAKKSVLADRIRKAGPEHILYGTDGAWADFTPVKGLAAYRELPLSGSEFKMIDANVPSYMPRVTKHRAK